MPAAITDIKQGISWFFSGTRTPEPTAAAGISVQSLIEQIEASHRASTDPATTGWLQMTVTRIESESDDVKSFYLTTTNNRPLPKFDAGQHVLVSNNGHDAENAVDRRKSLSRCYTLSGTANPRYWRISVKRQPVPEVSRDQSLSNYLHQHVKVGDHLQVKGPRGHFTIQKAAQSPVLLFGAGVGVTPVVAMASELVSHEFERPIWIFYQTQSPEQAALAGELLQLAAAFPNVSLNIAFSKVGKIGKNNRTSNVQFFGGRVAPLVLAEMTPHFQTGHCFLCGPAQWMTDTIDALEERGFCRNRIHYESFGSVLASGGENGAATEPGNVVNGFSVNCRDSKIALNFQDQQGSLLDQLQKAGADVAGGCRVGNCGTCMVRLLRGQIDPGTSNCPDLQAGWMLPCVAVPQSDIEVQV